MDLFEVNNGTAFPTAHALLIEPFKTIWNSDPDPKHSNAIKVFSYVYLLCSPKKSNPFLGYSEEDRPRHVKKEVYGDQDKVDTDFMIMATMKYKELLAIASPTYTLLNAALSAKDKLVDYLENFDLSERTQGGTAVIKPADITKALKEVPDVARSIIAMVEKVNMEIIEEAKTRNQREIGQYER
jgi:hypothetical protein